MWKSVMYMGVLNVKQTKKQLCPKGTVWKGIFDQTDDFIYMRNKFYKWTKII